jgi:thymidylate synthase (FAD)
MQVRVVAVTQPVTSECSDVDAFIEYAARVSNPSGQDKVDTQKKLIKYLIEHKHWSPFEMASATVEIVTTRDIARQILRHRSFSFQEFSQRYAAVSEFETKEPRSQDLKNRQNSIDNVDNKTAEWWYREQERLLGDIEYFYDSALKKGIAKECARAILPEGLTRSKLYMSGTFRSWIHYLQQRCDPATQLEHRNVANEIKRVLSQHSLIIKYAIGD